MTAVERSERTMHISDGPMEFRSTDRTYKSEVATAEIRPMKSEFRPINTEVTELRPIKLDPAGSLRRIGSESARADVNVPGSATLPSRRLASESATAEMRGQNKKYDHNYNTDYKSYESTHKESSSTSQTMYSSQASGPTPAMTTTHIKRTMVNGNQSPSPGVSPTSTMSSEYKRGGVEFMTAEVKRRDVSPNRRVLKQDVTLIEGKCSCCPYGYHIDLDFVNFCDNLASGSYLKKLKKIQREKRKLRKSMEVYLQQQDGSHVELSPSPPPEQEGRINVVEYQQGATTSKLLDEIDSSVDATIHSIDTMMKTSKQRSYSDMATAEESPQPRRKFNTFPKQVGRQVAQELEQYNETFSATLNTTNRTDSTDSLSSISTSASERGPSVSYSHKMDEMFSHTTKITSEQLAATMAMHMPVEDGAASPYSSTTNINKSSLQAIREAMAVSLQRMRELEEQAKAIPVLQVRISVLKEEKRLLALQMKAQNQKSTRDVGVMYYVEEVPRPDFSFPASPRSSVSSPRSPPPTAPKPKVKMAAVGDHSVHETYLLQPELESTSTETSTHVLERETILIDRTQPLQTTPKPLTCSVGVGEGNVFDDSLHIHEKELRTVIIGQGGGAGKRNVGIECRPLMRDVGVSYAFDSEKPSTRTVGINVDTGSLIQSLSFKAEEMRSALREVLSKNVRSIGVQSTGEIRKVDVGVQFSVSAWNLRSIGVGDCTVDVEVRNRVARRSIGLDIYPDRMNRAMNTDYGWKLDASTNTVKEFMDSKAVCTEHPRLLNTSTMTEKEVKYNQLTQTDSKVFIATDQVKTVGCNTTKVIKHNMGMNTVLKPKVERGVNTIQNRSVYNKGINTERVRTFDVACSDDTVDSFVCSFEDKNSEEDYRMEEESVETKTTYYATEAAQAKSDEEKGYQIKREYSDSYQAAASETVTEEHEEESEEEDRNEEIVEEKVWRTTGDGQFMVTTVVTKRNIGGSEDDVVREVKTVTGGPEVLGSAAGIIQEEIAKGNAQKVVTVKKSGSESPVRTYVTGGRFGADDSASSSRQIQYSSSSYSPSATQRFGTELDGLSSSYEAGAGEGHYTTRREYTMTTSGSGSDLGSGSVHKSYSRSGGELRSASALLGAELNDLRKVGADSGDSAVTTVEYSYTSDSGIGSPAMMSSSEQSFSSGLGSNEETEIVTRTISSEGGQSRVVSTRQTSGGFGGDGTSALRSIMKKSSSDHGAQTKKGITFAETVVGGAKARSETDTSNGESTAEEEEEEEGSRGTTESDSDSSYEEGCYDSREGSIVYTCKDDEAIAKGIPGAQMFDQNIRETYELSQEMQSACQVLATYLEDSISVTTKQLNASVEVISEDWFKASSSKLSSPHQVEDYLSCFNEISRRLLEYIVNLQDTNGNTAIHYAVSHCNFEIVGLLLDTGVCDLNKKNKAGYTSIIMATLASVQTERQQEVTQRLFSMGDVNIRSAKDGQTALMFAVQQGRTEMVRMLVDTGADVNAQDDEGSTALMCAAEHGHTDIIKLLLNTAGCDAALTDNDGSTALSISMDAGHKDAGVLLYAHVNFGPGNQSPGPMKKSRKSSGSSPLPSPTLR